MIVTVVSAENSYDILENVPGQCLSVPSDARPSLIRA